MRPKIAILYSLARSGGTLVSKCLGCMPGHVLLSEIHPRWAYFNPLIQANEWFKLISDEELNEIKRTRSTSHVDGIRLINQRCTETGQQLIIRDWTHVDFMPIPDQVSRVSPIYRLSHHEVLKNHFDIRHIALVRHPLDSLLSLQKVPDFRGRLDASVYMAGYRRFAEIASGIGFIRYEDFCDKPAEVMERLCKILELSYHPGFLEKYQQYTKITGDIIRPGQQHTLTGEPIGERTSTIIRRPPPRTAPPELVQRLQDDRNYQETLRILGYATTKA